MMMDEDQADADAIPMAIVTGPPDVPPPSRTVRLLKSWKRWLLGLFVALAAIGVSLGIRGYRRFQALEYLDANGCPYELTEDSEWITDWFGDRAKGFRSVESIRLDVVSDESFSRIAVFPETRRLSTIAFIGVTQGTGRLDTITSRGIDALARLTELESIEIHCGWFDDSLRAQLFSVGRPLKSITLNIGKLGRETLEALTTHASLTSLELLASTDDEDFRGLSPLPLLQSLKLADVGPECANWLSQSTRLREVQLNVTTLDTQIMQVIARLPQLEALSLYHCRVVSGDPFAPLASLPRLKSLSLCECRNVTAETLAQMVDFPRLESLTLPTEAITWETFETLRLIPSLKRITVNAGDIDDPELLAAVEREWEYATLYHGCLP